MENSLVKASEGLIGPSYSTIGQQNRQSRTQLFANLFHQRRLPEHGWDEHTVRMLLLELSGLDLNNSCGVVGVGEREGRVFSNIVKNRHFDFSHGIGRSGNIMDLQPKAPGSSILNRLTQYLARDMLWHCGLLAMADCIVLPLATGMSLSMCMAVFRTNRPNAKYVIWSRIDQKSCIKSIVLAGFQLVVIQLIQKGDALCTDVAEIEKKINELGPENIACVSTTTSTFAPRTPDDIPAVAGLCLKYDVPHLVNNAYGLQCSRCVHLVETGSRTGRVDFVVQSTDKNFMVPVGGTIIASPKAENIAELSRIYPGRASSTPTLDLFITFLQMGKSGFDELRKERKRLFEVLRYKMGNVSKFLPIKMLETPLNGISIAIDVSKVSEPTKLGSALFLRRCSGPRVVVCKQAAPRMIAGVPFSNFGSHSDTYPCSYLTVACTIGATEKELSIFIERLEAVSQNFRIAE